LQLEKAKPATVKSLSDREKADAQAGRLMETIYYFQLASEPCNGLLSLSLSLSLSLARAGAFSLGTREVAVAVMDRGPQSNRRRARGGGAARGIRSGMKSAGNERGDGERN